ncbi:DKNYY domain-containing protein [Dyadobacter sp. CY107]|uniref:DKNYY domain-containing protein n=1 Tax=Dyadobacter fanqingshengii TaxID=2906443 RepID=UPI001F26814F|nr:DKNYY domain-containing protein [Dyadobacter fanqingshengii]MCF2505932.1 DKNYY domain-containing protein [Dyadobacter fanqingshengii]
MALKNQIRRTFVIMGLLGFFSNLFSCSDSKSGFKPGLLTARGYYVKNGKAYWYGGFSNAELIELTSANAKSFITLDEKFPNVEFASSYASDGKHVYFNGGRIKDADGQTFEVLGYGWGKDARNVYSWYSIVSDDAQHYVDAKGGLKKDSKHVYSGDKIVSDDPESLKFLGTVGYHSYHSDSRGIMSGRTRIDSADVATFRPLDHGYSVDKSQVFLLETTKLEILKDADAKSFQVISEFYTKDAVSVFWRGEKLTDANPGTFKIISEEHHCSCDDKRVYHHNKIVPNADPAKFPAGKKYKYCNDSEIVFD